MIQRLPSRKVSVCAAQGVLRRVAHVRGALLSVAIAACIFATAHAQTRLHRDAYGATTRGDTANKTLVLVFTGDEYAESTAPILDELKEHNIKASFFVTGNFLRRVGTARLTSPKSAHQNSLLKRILAEGHYLGSHSDSHPLYADWTNRDKTLVTKAFFTADLNKNISDLRAVGALPLGKPIYFIPPYEWYNRDQVEWCHDLSLSLRERAGVRGHRGKSTSTGEPPASQVILINFTPGTGSNRDYAPEGHKHFVPSQRIYDDILAYEQKDPHGLNGFLLLLHLGSGRRDPFHSRLGGLCDELNSRGYTFARVDELFE